MNWDRVEGNWKKFKGRAKQQWGMLTHNRLDVIAGRREQLAGEIQEQYGSSRQDANEQVKVLQKRYQGWNPKL